MKNDLAKVDDLSEIADSDIDRRKNRKEQGEASFEEGEIQKAEFV